MAMIRRVHPATLVLVLLAAVPSSSLHAQRIAGFALQEGWGDPVAGAKVILLDSSLLPVDSTVADDRGRFAFRSIASGTYYIQAEFESLFSELSAPIDATEAATDDEIVVTFHSQLFRMALECAATGLGSGTGVLAGFAFDNRSGIPLPSARISIQWDRPGSAVRGRMEARSDAGGRFVVCGVPSGIELTAWSHVLGRISHAHHNIVVDERALARHDLGVDLDVGTTALQVLRSMQERDEDHFASLTGRLVDAGTGEPVRGAVVTLAGVPGEAVTDNSGRFRFREVDPGSYAINVRHLGYGQQGETVELPGGSDVTVDLRLAARAVELEGIQVTARAIDRARRATTSFTRSLAGARLRHVELRGASVAEAVSDIPGLRISYGRFMTDEGPADICVERTRNFARMNVVSALEAATADAAQDSMPQPRLLSTDGSWCDMVEVVIDGIPVPNPAPYLQHGVQDYESIDYLGPLEATRVSYRATLMGALVLWTRGRGPHVDPARNR